MESLFTQLTHALHGAPLVALGAAFVWGVLSIVLSPCHLASIPLIVGYLQGGSPVAPRRAATLSLLFALGILGSLAVLGALTAAAGRLLGDIGPGVSWVVAALLLIFGLHLAGTLPLPDAWRPTLGQPRRGAGGALLFGLVFGLALGPCTFGFVAPVLGLTFSLAGSAPLLAAGILALFALGHCAVIAFAGASSSWVQRWLDWQQGTAGATWLRRACGLLLVAAAIWLAFSAWPT
ncbi:cytochrome c biogenesis protein CcdA [Opitutus sp. ER46]|uniref:cytochrome c biogenesis CcdA family protein n=1 Tax=Opitutus sp. ER46 TaxID=2161864 RepID=UPI000D2F4F22|nr:cytochrome c biogenesis protein CcdA [Opitutus sp. ER46]PTY00651.1 cytochrome C biogenesis protein [Opitutus sp. ER46]